MDLSRREFAAATAAFVATSCTASRNGAAQPNSDFISFEVFSEEFERVVAPSGAAQLLGQGYGWAEGPAWDRARQALYFTDVPANRAYRWTQKRGVEIFLDPSGIESGLAQGMREPGANGLLMSRDGRLILCNHGKRALEKMVIETESREVLVGGHQGKRFNSPNDVIEASDGTLYFTDPPYGLEGLDDSPLKEMSVNGVYRLSPDGSLDLLISDMTFPNGVALSPDQSTLIIAQSDRNQPIVRKLNLNEGGSGEIWFDASPFMQGHEGLPDGMAVSQTGHVFLAGPGGILVLSDEGQCIGRIGTGRATANCAFGRDGRTLFITARDMLISVETKVKGVGHF